MQHSAPLSERQARYKLPPQDARLQHLAGIPAATRLHHFGAVATGLQPRGIRVAPTPVPGATRLQHRHEGQPLGFKSDAALALRSGLNPRAIPEPLANNTRAEAENVPLGYCSVSPRPCAGAKPTQRPIAGTPCTDRAESKTGRKIADKPHPSYPPSRANPCKPRSCEHPKTPLQGAPAQGSEASRDGCLDVEPTMDERGYRRRTARKATMPGPRCPFPHALPLNTPERPLAEEHRVVYQTRLSKAPHLPAVLSSCCRPRMRTALWFMVTRSATATGRGK
jgi:hypothetical protein